VQAIDMVETYRELASSLMDQLMTKASNRLNEVMKVLTVLSTIFLPMTFIAGVYGMNFDGDVSPWNMPELRWTLGYPFSLGLMLASSIGLLLYYRRMGWIGRADDTYAKVARALGRRNRARPRED
jgi:magnesium transporter